jgi:hypothetical protein
MEEVLQDSNSFPLVSADELSRIAMLVAKVHTCVEYIDLSSAIIYYNILYLTKAIPITIWCLV